MITHAQCGDSFPGVPDAFLRNLEQIEIQRNSLVHPSSVEYGESSPFRNFAMTGVGDGAPVFVWRSNLIKPDASDLLAALLWRCQEHRKPLSRIRPKTDQISDTCVAWDRN